MSIHSDTLIINNGLSTFGRFISDGIEIENYPSLKYATIENLKEGDYTNFLQLLKSLKLKLKISEKFIRGDTLVINLSLIHI